VTDTVKALVWPELGELDHFFRLIFCKLLAHKLTPRDSAQLQWDLGSRSELAKKN